MSKFYIGQTINNLSIIKIEKASKGNRWITFQCKCSKLVKLHSTNVYFRIKRNTLIDCGCENPNRLQRGKQELLGKKFGKLLVVNYAGQKKHYINNWGCLCDCGNFTIVSRSNLTHKSHPTTSCGRCKQKHSPKWGGYRDISLSFWNTLKNQAILRNLIFSINIKDVWDLYEKQNRKCALSGRSLSWSPRTASIDRINSKIGYTIDNIQIVHCDINIMKNKFDQNYFIQTCKEIISNKNTNIIPSWIEYFLGISKVIATKSKDSETKVGCVIVDDSNHIISTGYNSFPKGMIDKNLPSTRPNKYPYILHAEASAIANSTTNLHAIKNGCTIYISTRPCLECLKLIINSNIKNIYAINSDISKETSKHQDIYDLYLEQSKINYNIVSPDLSYLNHII